MAASALRQLIAGPPSRLPWDAAFEVQDGLLETLAASADAREGAAAFVEKRPPRWTGRP